jgi:hypothetical protein
VSALGGAGGLLLNLTACLTACARGVIFVRSEEPSAPRVTALVAAKSAPSHGLYALH